MYFNLVPNHVELMHDLGEARFLYGHILSLSSQYGHCFAFNSFFSKIMNRDERTIRRYLKQLSDKKLIVISKSPTGSRIITAIDTFVGRKLQLKRNNNQDQPLDPELETLLDEIYKAIK